MPYTVLVNNEALGKSHFCGTFATLEEACQYAEAQANRSRSFAEFVVYLGTPKNWDKPTGQQFRGKK